MCDISQPNLYREIIILYDNAVIIGECGSTHVEQYHAPKILILVHACNIYFVHDIAFVHVCIHVM